MAAVCPTSAPSASPSGALASGECAHPRSCWLLARAAVLRVEATWRGWSHGAEIPRSRDVPSSVLSCASISQRYQRVRYRRRAVGARRRQGSSLKWGTRCKLSAEQTGALPWDPQVVIQCPRCSSLGSFPPRSTEGSCPNCRVRHLFRRCKNCLQPVMAEQPYNDSAGSWFRCPSCRTKTRSSVISSDRPKQVEAIEVSHFQGLESIDPASAEVATLVASTLIGGWNLPFSIGTQLTLATTSKDIRLTPTGPPGPPAAYPLTEMTSLEFGGPGLQVHGGGFIGGGFGVKGAAEGIVAADLLNRLTTKTTLNSQINIVMKERGLLLHSATITPEQLAIKFTAAVGRIANQCRAEADNRPAIDDRDRLVAQLERLANLYDSGALTDEEYTQAKARLLGA